LNLSAFEWMDIEDFQMQLIDSKNSHSGYQNSSTYGNSWKQLKTNKQIF